MGVASEMRLLHYVQEQQRRKEEAVIARKKIFELEDTIRELQERLANVYSKTPHSIPLK